MRNRINRISPSCDERGLRDLLNDLLPRDECHRVESHVERCPDCQAKLERLAADDDLWHGLPRLLQADELDGDAADPLAERNDYRDWRSASRERLIEGLIEPSIMPDILGHFGAYEIERVLGAGAMGIVMKGFDLKLNRDVAIKVLSPEYSGNGVARQRFEREARSVAAVVHPHVVPIHAVDAENDPPYLVMAHVAGESLQQRITRTGPLDFSDALRCAMQAAQGLAAAHAQGIVHRDIKPANILLDEAGRVLLSDFGLARAVDDVTMTHVGMLAGTPEYMSPEQSRGEAVDHRSDLFSLGCVMYAMCTGESPFRAPTTLAVMKRICETTPRDIREENPDVPHWFAATTNKLLSKNPGDRFQSSSELAMLLEKCVAHMQQPTVIPLPPEIARLADASAAEVSLGRRLFNRRYLVPGACAVLAAGVSPFLFRGFGTDPESVSETDNSAIQLRRVINLKDAWITCVAFTADGKSVAGCGYRWIQLFDINTGRFQKRFAGHKRDILGIAFSPDGRWLASCGRDNSVRLWNMASGKEERLLGEFEGVTDGAAFSPDSSLLVTSSGIPNPTVQFWDVKTGRLHAKDPFHALYVAFSPDGSTLAAGGFHSRVRVYNIKGFRPEMRFERRHDGDQMVSYVAYSPDGKRLLSSGWDNTIRIWDAESGRAIRTLNGPAHARCVESAAFFAGGSRIVSVTRDETIQIWDATTGRLLHTHRGNNEAVRGLAVSKDEQTLATCGHDMNIKLWDLRSPAAES